MKNNTLTGITWDHPRGYQPLYAAASEWKKISGVDILWKVRTLKEFGDTPVEELVRAYDLVVIDHPYMGEAYHGGLLVHLNEHLSAEEIDLRRSHAIGRCFSSYEYNGRLLAVSIDAAAQVCAKRTDLMEKLRWSVPTNTASLKDAAGELPRGYYIGIPLCATDIWCVFLTLCAQHSGHQFFQYSGIDEETGEWALEQLREWKQFIHPHSLQMNPIQMLDRMAVENDIVYSPFLFGYSNYSRKSFAGHHISFGNVPEFRAGGLTSILGGAGIAVSQNTNHLRACIDFVKYISDPQTQKTLYYPNGGQPAYRSVWDDAISDTDSGHFFSATRETLDRAYLRPRWPGFNRFQEEAADRIHRSVQSDSGVHVVRELNNLLKTYCGERVL